MKLIALDCEFNQPSKRTIEIGAVCFEPNGKLPIETFRTYVNPSEPIDNDITMLTLIDDVTVQNAPDILEAAHMLTAFKLKHQINAIPIVWGGGLSNDVRHIYEEACTESPFANRVIDVKAVYQMLANVGKQDMRSKVGLGKALDMVGIGWDSTYGDAHGALADAYNTMRMYRFLSDMIAGAFDFTQRVGRNL